jgi:2-oxoglutarate dehydrogenase E1 component
MTMQDDFSAPNLAYVLEQYERYQRDANAVDATWRTFFADWTPPADSPLMPARHASAPPAKGESSPPDQPDVRAIVGAANYAAAIREDGMMVGDLNPLSSSSALSSMPPVLDYATYGLTLDDLERLPASIIGGAVGERCANAREATEALFRLYAGTIGYDFDHIRDPNERMWLRDAVESGRYAPPAMPIDEIALLHRLTEVEGFELFLNRVFPGKHRFSIEGLDMLIPVLDESIRASVAAGEHSILLGMAHRGRLNVLTHTLGKPYLNILAEFKDPVAQDRVNDDLGWTGDVKYHLGGRRTIHDQNAPVDAMIALAPNPSHLEAVNPVVEGMARAAGTRVDQAGAPHFDPQITQPILIHGDAAFPGQGIVAETLNLYRLPGYWTGGTLHIITNNQIGFTTDPGESRSTRYASDIAKGFKIPVIHVNADDPIACISVTRFAVAYIQAFQKDIVIDLIGYRRRGHNEGDEPAFTQPQMYKGIDHHPTARALWGKALVARGVIADGEPEKLVEQHTKLMQATYEQLDPARDLIDYRPQPPLPGTARRVKTAVDLERLKAIYAHILNIPLGFTPHPRLKQRVLAPRGKGLEQPAERLIDFATAETLALGCILEDGIAVRVTGQDAQRGTFSHRHAVIHDMETYKQYIPLQALPTARAAFEVHNSPLSEAAALGFEYGYNVQAPERLVIWEAQYGDFINGAQTIIDEFIVSARNKFGTTPSLVMLLPHGYEGAGPDHSSARIERFLQMAADINLRVANPTTAAQYYHLLRRQALLLESDPLPLVVATPKSLLRNPLVLSSLEELAGGAWQPVIDDEAARDHADDVRRLVLCSGKLYADLVADVRREGDAEKKIAPRPDIALIRIEQLYPFPMSEIAAALRGYPNAVEVVWAQEEPENMGAWTFARPILEREIDTLPLRYVGRAPNASPAEGSLARHNINQAAILDQVYAPIDQPPRPVATRAAAAGEPVTTQARERDAAG